jgi:hypothetical protein
VANKKEIMQHVLKMSQNSVLLKYIKRISIASSYTNLQVQMQVFERLM